jgi:hypothetical protein
MSEKGLARAALFTKDRMTDKTMAVIDAAGRLSGMNAG